MRNILKTLLAGLFLLSTTEAISLSVDENEHPLPIDQFKHTNLRLNFPTRPVHSPTKIPLPPLPEFTEAHASALEVELQKMDEEVDDYLTETPAARGFSDKNEAFKSLRQKHKRNIPKFDSKDRFEYLRRRHEELHLHKAFRQVTAAYKKLDTVPFGKRIGLSVDVSNGESLSFDDLELASNAGDTKYTVVDQDLNIDEGVLPFTTYVKKYTTSTGETETAVVSVDSLDHSVFARVLRPGRKTLMVHKYPIARIGFGASEEGRRRLRKFRQNHRRRAALLAKDENADLSSLNEDNFETLAAEDDSDGDEDMNDVYVTYELEEGAQVFPGVPDTANIKPEGSCVHKQSDEMDIVFNDDLENNSDDAANETPSRQLNTLPIYTNCHSGGAKTVAAVMAMTVDWSAFRHYMYETTLGFLNVFIQHSVVTNSLVFEAQMNVQLKLKELLIWASTGQYPPFGWNAVVGNCPVMDDQLILFRDFGIFMGWDKYASQQLLTICNRTYTGRDGVPTVASMQGGVCTNWRFNSFKPYVSTGVRSLAHALGHIFGSLHTFDYVTTGQGTTGGILDEGVDGRLLPTHPTAPNEYGFHEIHQNPICSRLQQVINFSNMVGEDACFIDTTLNAPPVCGNGIIEQGEECEVGWSTPDFMPGENFSSPNCCINCKYAPNANCSGDNDCCVNCRMMGPTTPCKGPQQRMGICGYHINGPVCSTKPDGFDTCFNPHPSGSCAGYCNQTLSIYFPNRSICGIPGELYLNSGTCNNHQCEPAQYHWLAGPVMGHCVCTAPGVGTRAQAVHCVSSAQGQIVSETLCNPALKPVPVSCGSTCL